MINLAPVAVATVTLEEGQRPTLRDIEAVAVTTLHTMRARVTRSDVGLQGEALAYATSFGEMSVELFHDASGTVTVRLTGTDALSGTKTTAAALVHAVTLALKKRLSIQAGNKVVALRSSTWLQIPTVEKAA